MAVPPLGVPADPVRAIVGRTELPPDIHIWSSYDPVARMNIRNFISASPVQTLHFSVFQLYISYSYSIIIIIV